MMLKTSTTNSTPPHAATRADAAELPVPPAVLNALAGTRCGRRGCSCWRIGADGTIAYHDAGAESFFIRYAPAAAPSDRIRFARAPGRPLA